MYTLYSYRVKKVSLVLRMPRITANNSKKCVLLTQIKIITDSLITLISLLRFYIQHERRKWHAFRCVSHCVVDILI